VAHLKRAHKKFSRVAAVLDRAPQHRAREADELLPGCGVEAGLTCPPVGTHELNAVEGSSTSCVTCLWACASQTLAASATCQEAS